MNIIVKENVKNIEEFNFLYDSVGWGHYEDIISKVALDNTLYSVSLYDEDKIIGYGRIIGDLACFLYIQDIMVRKEYQGNNVGSKIMTLLLKKIENYKKINPTLRVYLGASKNKEKFYQKFGFVTRKEADLGAGMILANENEQ